MLSRTQQYALRAMVFLGRAHGGGSLRTSDLAEHAGIPGNYLSKILHQMSREGLVDSERGRRGGVSLSRPPSRIMLKDVLQTFQPVHESRRCVLGRPECSDDYPCGAHADWKKIKEQIETFFETTSIADVMGEAVLPEDPAREVR